MKLKKTLRAFVLPYLLTVLLLLTIMPGKSAAASVNVSTWQQFSTACDNYKTTGGTINFTGSITMPAGGEKIIETTVLGKTITINTCGYTLSVGGSSVVIKSGVAFKGDSSKNPIITVTADGAVTLSGGEINQPTSNAYSAVYVLDGGVFLQKSGIVKGQTGIKVSAGGEAVFSGGSVLGSTTYSIAVFGVNVEAGGKATIGGDTHILIESPYSRGAYSNGELYINGNCRIETNGQNVSAAVSSWGGATAVITGGSIISNGVAIVNQGVMTLSGGDISSTGRFGLSNSLGGAITISGGTISGTEYGISNSSDLIMTGGIIQNGINLRETGTATLYQGRIYRGINAAGINLFDDPSSNPTLVYYTDFITDGISKNSSQTKVYKRDSFSVSPATLQLTRGPSSSVTFTVKGQRPNGAALSLQDFFGNSGSLPLNGGGSISYTVVGNKITFSPTITGFGSISIDDKITYTGITTLSVAISDPPASTTSTTATTTTTATPLPTTSATTTPPQTTITTTPPPTTTTTHPSSPTDTTTEEVTTPAAATISGQSGVNPEKNSLNTLTIALMIAVAVLAGVIVGFAINSKKNKR